MMTEELKNVAAAEPREVALVTAFIIREDILMGTVYQTFDKAYEIAVKFVDSYPSDLDWGVDDIRDEDGNLITYDWDEAVINFARKRMIPNDVIQEPK